MLTKPILAALIITSTATAVFADGVEARASVRTDEPARPAANAAPRPWHPGLSRERLHLVLRDGADVRLRGGKLESPSGSFDTAALNAVLALPGLKIERLYTAGEAELAEARKKAERRSGKKVGDLNLDFLVRLPKGADIDDLTARLMADELVAAAYAEPLPVGPPATPDFSGYQTYATPAPDGINVGAARALAGGTGDRVRIIDIEYGWNTNHEDLAKSRGQFIPNGTPVTAHVDHGTAVLGELIGTPNGIGVTGLIPDAAIGMVNASTTAGNALHDAIYVAAQNLRAGDVILLEVHYPGPRSADPENSQFGFMPAEYWSAYYKAIQWATANGIIVVEAAGNGHQNLDEYGWPGDDSGAIMVGASEAPNCGSGTPRSRMDFSNHGSRVDVHAHGECVITTGYGGAYNGGPNAKYHWFSGTSSASPIVAAAAGLLSSVIEARTGSPARPRDVETILKSTGTSQATGTGTLAGNIGPMPDLSRALAHLGYIDRTAPVVTGPYQTAAAGYGVTAAGTVPTRISWSATDASGITQFAVQVSTNGGAWANLTLPSATATSVTLDLTPGTAYRFSVAARDGAGNWSARKAGATFRPALIRETHSAVAYSSGWTQATWTSATDGSLKVSGTARAWAKLTFTGRSIAWVGTMAANRGQAKVWIDSTYLGMFDLHRNATAARRLIVARNVDPSIQHTMTIEVVGTSGRPKVDIDGFVILK